MLMLIVSEDRYEEIQSQPQKDSVVHMPIISAPDMVTHLREMVQAGYTDEEMLALHPEISNLFSNNNFEPIQGDIE